MNPRNFFAEMQRRNVYRVAVAYLAVAWLLIQIATQIFPFLEIPWRVAPKPGRATSSPSDVSGRIAQAVELVQDVDRLRAELEAM